MIRVERSECISHVFGEQDIATMNAFGSIFVEDGALVCQAGIRTADGRSFFCIRHDGHEGIHIAVGTRVVAIFSDDAVDFRDSIDDVVF